MSNTGPQSEASMTCEAFILAVGDSDKKAGEAAISKAVGVSVVAVRMQVGRSYWPSGWYEKMNELAQSKAVDCPMSMFKWNKPERKVRPEAAE